MASPGATSGGHKLEWEKCSPKQQPPFFHQRGDQNKIFQLNRTGGHCSPFWGFFSLQWGPMWHRLVLLLEAISWSWRVVPHRKNLPFATREVTNKIFQLNTTRGTPFPSLGMLLPAKTPPKRNGRCDESSGPIQGDRKFRNLASFAFAI